MSKLSDVTTSSELKEEQRFEISEMIPIIGSPVTKTVGSERVIFKLSNNRKKGRVWVDNIADCYNEETKKVERARILIGVDALWIKDQKHIDKDYAAHNKPQNFCFEDGKMAIGIRNENLIKFMRMRDGFLENKNRGTGAKDEYYEWNPQRQEQEALEKEMLEIEAMQLAMAQPFDKLKKHAAYIGGVSFVDELGEPRTEQGVRTLYVRQARRDPKKFKESLDSKEVEVSYLIRKALIDARIDVGNATGLIKWANGGVICSMPRGNDPYKHLFELALSTSSEGKQFLEQLQKIIT